MASSFNPSSVISDVNIAAPDFALMSKAASSVQGRYLQGFNQLKSFHNSLLNSRVSSKDNQAFRDNFFKKVDQYMTNLGGVDFSNPNNVSTGTALFDPLVKDKEFIYDLNWSMQQSYEQQKSEEARTNRDEKVRSQYNPIIDIAMGYAQKDMSEAKRGDGSMYKTPVQKYVPFSNLENVLNDAADKLKLNVSIDSTTGSYIITDKNGQNAIPIFHQWARQQLGSNYDEQLLITAKVGVRGQVERLMQSNPNLTKEEAFQKVAQDNSLGVYQNMKTYTNGLLTGISTIDRQITELNSQYKGKIKKGSEVEARIAQLKTLKETYKKELTDAKANKDSSKEEEMKVAFQQFMQNPEYTLLPVLKDQVAQSWAKGYAMTHAERQIKPDAVALQRDDQAFKSMMFDKQFKKDLYMEDIKAKNALDLKMFELSATGAMSGVSTAPSKIVGSDTPYNRYTLEKAHLADESIKGYFDPTVLEVATHIPVSKWGDANEGFGYTYPVISQALEDVITRWGNNRDPEYLANYKIVLKFLNKINPQVTKISSMSDIVSTITSGVNSYKGDFAKFNAADEKIRNASLNFMQYKSLHEQEMKLRSSVQGTPFSTTDYWDVDPKTGRVKLRDDLSEDQRNAISEKITPDYEKYKSQTGTMASGFMFNGDPEKFNYSSIDEVIQKATYVTGIGDNELSSEKAKKIKDALAGAGHENAEVFDPSGMTVYEYPMNGQTWLQVNIPVKSDKKGNKKVADAVGGSVSFYIPPDQARDLWQSTNTFSLLGQEVKMPTYGKLARVPSSIYNTDMPTDWINHGLSTQGKVAFDPTVNAILGLTGGELSFGGMNNSLYATFNVNNKTTTYPLSITRAEYLNDPTRWSNTIMKALMDFSKQLKQSKVTSMKEEQTNHDLAVMENPEEYVDINDIPSQA